MRDNLQTYIAAQIPSWVAAALAFTMLARWSGSPGPLALGFLALWIVKDLLLFPAMGRYYRSEPAERRIVGKRGTAATDIAPHGFVRVHGELWQADSDQPIAEGAEVVVRDVDGLRLSVAPVEWAGDRSQLVIDF